jgi:hypothetical protein
MKITSNPMTTYIQAKIAKSLKKLLVDKLLFL